MNDPKTDTITMSKPGRKPAGKPDPGDLCTRAVRMRVEYAAWLEDFAAFNRSTIAGLIDQGLMEFARVKGFKKPPRRT